MVGAWGGDYAVPDDGLIRRVAARARAARRRPLGCHVDEQLLGVPSEKRREVGVKGELYYCVLLLLGGVVVWAAADTEWGWC